MNYTDIEKAKIGRYLAEVFKLKRNMADRWVLGDGYADKTSIGLFNVFMGIASQIERGTTSGIGEVLDASDLKALEQSEATRTRLQ